MRHEGFSVVLANVAVCYETRFAAQIPRKLPTVVIFDNDRMTRAFQNLQNRVAVQWHEPTDLQLIRADSLLIQDLAGFLEHPFRGSPADQRHFRVART